MIELSESYKIPTIKEYLERELKEIEKLPDGSWAYHGSPPVTKMALEYFIKDILKRTNESKIESNLNRVIKALEYMQEEKYDPYRTLTLSYFYDVRDDNIPKNLTIEKKI